MKIKKCRICKKKKFSFLFTLGNLSFTGKFAKNFKTLIPRRKVSLILCENCKLVQLDQNFNPKYLYGKDYGYRTGINQTMTDHVKVVVKEAQKISRIKKGDYVLDIASNDGTLLNFYSKNLIRVGIDPIINKFLPFYKNIDYKINDFFNFRVLQKKKIDKKYKVITALSVFYDLKNPLKFIGDIKKILHKDGIFILEHADLLSILRKNLFDTICHEHLEYYSSKIIINIMKKHNLRVFDLKSNDINGGSMRYFISHELSQFKSNTSSIKRFLNKEKKLKLENPSTFESFFRQINKQKTKLNILIKKLKKGNKIIHGYGASTKGNVLLQYFDITNKHIDYIADRNPKKFGFFTPGTRIKIISEKLSRKIKPDYYLVLPWHFKNEIIRREKNIIKKGTKFIFPLPDLKVL